jgi:tRNA (adenine22-N1)-methyltransferase
LLTKPKLSKRLQAIVDFVPPVEVVADIGCDHAYVAISLILNQKADFAYGIDNKTEPLKVALNNVLAYQLKSKISLLKNPISESIRSLDGCIIAGVGKDSAVAILNEFETNFQDSTYICLQVNAQVIDMRIHMKERGYKLVDEIVVDDKKHYVITLYEKGLEIHEGPQLLIGPYLLKNIDKYAKYFEELKQIAVHFRSIAQDPLKQSMYAMIDDYLQGIL